MIVIWPTLYVHTYGRETGDAHDLSDLHRDGHRVSVVRHIPGAFVDVDGRLHARAATVVFVVVDDGWASSSQKRKE